MRAVRVSDIWTPCVYAGSRRLAKPLRLPVCEYSCVLVVLGTHHTYREHKLQPVPLKGNTSLRQHGSLRHQTLATTRTKMNVEVFPLGSLA